MNTILKFVLLGSALFASWVEADIVSDFKALDQQRKGPFTVNYLQHVRGRQSLGGGATDGCIRNGGGSGRFQFQAAFRNALAQRLADQDFYVGNLFSTNYYQLVGEYVFGDPCGSHDDDHAGLLATKDSAMPKAASMVRHWVLEKHYLEHNSGSALTRAFRLRGISDSANEAEYAMHFFNFYLSSMTAEFQFLPAYLLVKESPVGQSASIDEARRLVADSYDFFHRRFCGGDSPSGAPRCSDQRVKRMYQLRNAVHNQLSQDVILEINQYLADFPFYEAEGHTYLQRVREILKEYYSFSAQKIVAQARKGGFPVVEFIAAGIARDGVTVTSLLQLSEAGADLRATLGTLSVEHTTSALVTIALISQFVNKEINMMSVVDSKDVVLAILNSIYMEGFLIKDNWQYFADEVQAASDISGAVAQLPDILEIAQATLDEAFTPALKQWVSVEPSMQFFVDNTIKSSSLNTASILAEKLKR